MAIWSLTVERIEKLRKQIGDKEDEYKKLTNTSAKELWTTDLDDLVAEWNFQLDDEARRAKKSAAAGRRASAKLRIAGKTGSKKRRAGDDSDEEFAVSKPKKSALMANGKPKPSSAFDWMNKKSPSPPPKPKASQSLISAFAQQPAAKLEPQDVEMGLDGASNNAEEVEARPAAPAAAKKASAPAGRSKASKPAKKTVVDDDEDDMFMEIAAEAKSKPQPNGRQPRAAARKPVKYANDDDSEAANSSDENGDDFLGDVTNMVKGIPKEQNGANASKPLFSTAASRPSSSSSHGLVSNSKHTFKQAKEEDSEGEGETDFKSLVPRGSPEKPAIRKAKEIVLSDDDDDSFNMTAPKAALKSTSATGPSKASASTTGLKPKQASKATQQKQSKLNAAAPSAPKEPKAAAKSKSDLSPAAKAYAAKLAKGKQSDATTSKPPAQPKFSAASKSKKKTVESDEEEDTDALANDILGDEDGDDPKVVKPNASAQAAAGAGRPSRRAAAAPTARSKYVIDDDDDDDDDEDDDDDQQEDGDDSEADFDDDSE